MRVTFVKTGRVRDRLYVERDDGVERSFTVAKDAGAPYDLLHYVVETTLGLRHGFWGMIADGAEFEKAGKTRADATKPSRTLSGDLTELLQSEALVQEFRAAPGSSAESYLANIRKHFASTGVSAPPLEDPTVRRLHSAVTEVSDRWCGLEDGESIVAEWPKPIT